MAGRLPFYIASLTGLCFVAAISLSGCGSEFRDATQVTFTHRENSGQLRSVTIANPPEVKRITDSIELVPKAPCLCAHVDQAVFTTPKGTITASICDHCFDYNSLTYAMPDEFWRLFQAYIAAAPQTQPAR